mmetsp:Transcript_3009/g.11835  ORF Transcript_3009/g.11835 Transcript_3009/m.11835 type:complete len:234 (+) Transcript_3009:4382-5083(+)
MCAAHPSSSLTKGARAPSLATADSCVSWKTFVLARSPSSRHLRGRDGRGLPPVVERIRGRVGGREVAAGGRRALRGLLRRRDRRLLLPLAVQPRPQGAQEGADDRGGEGCRRDLPRPDAQGRPDARGAQAIRRIQRRDPRAHRGERPHLRRHQRAGLLRQGRTVQLFRRDRLLPGAGEGVARPEGSEREVRGPVRGGARRAQRLGEEVRGQVPGGRRHSRRHLRRAAVRRKVG